MWQESLGVHKGVTCDETGMNPIVGNRYHLIDRNYDLCEAGFLKLPDEEKRDYEKIPPPRPVRARPRARVPARGPVPALARTPSPRSQAA